MSRLFLVSAIICAISQQATAANITKSFQSNGPNTAVVYLEISNYLSVTMKENILTIEQIFKTNSILDTPPCKIIIDPFEDGILGRINAMGFMQSIVVWGVRRANVANQMKNTIYTMLLVNLRKCTYRPLQLPIDRVPLDYPTIPPRVQTIFDRMRGLGFNVFYQTLKRCAPCQYFPKDLRITDVDRQTKLTIIKPQKSMHVNSFFEMNKRIYTGYFLAYNNYGIGTARLEYVDKDFTTLVRRYLNDTVDAASVVVSKADRLSAAACWQHDRHQITCERYDSRLFTTVSYRVRGDCVSILFDIYENAYISTAEKSSGVHLQIYNVFGQLVDDIDFGAVGKSAQQLEVYAFLEDFDYPQGYCLVVKEYRKLLGTEADYSVKCINVREYTKLS